MPEDPFDLLDEIEKELGIGTYPMNWPIGSGKEFKGVYDREHRQILQLQPDGDNAKAGQRPGGGLLLDDPGPGGLPSASTLHDTLLEDVELLDGAGDDFDLEKVRHGKLSPVFFGSALTNFGVEPFLESFLQHDHPAPAPEHGPGRGRPLRPQTSPPLCLKSRPT